MAARKKSDVNPSEYSYVFKVVFPNKSYRHIRLSAQHRLEMLHDMILAETQFDDIWHLHSFFMDNKAYKSDCEIPCVEAVHEDYPSGILTDRDYTIFDLHLYLGQKFLYIFDFGDDWRFSCTVIDILKEPTGNPVVIASKGNPPIQYPYLADKK